jgi:hypothetical protein
MIKFRSQFLKRLYNYFKSYKNKDALNNSFIIKLVFCAIFNAILFCVVYKLSYIKFAINDDYGFNLFLSGAYGSQTGYTVYQNIVLGKIIVKLYNFVPAINWYSIVLMGSLYISFIIIDTMILDKFGKYIGFMLQIFISLVFTTLFMLNFQWTFCAYACIISGLVSMIHGYTCEKSKRNFCYFASGILFILGYMIRSDVFFMALLYIVGFVIIMLIINKKKAVNLVKFVILISLCCGFLYTINTMAYKNDPIWREYMNFNIPRSKLMDYGRMDYDKYEEVYKSVGWSKNDFNLFYSFIVPDESKFNTEAIQKILQARQSNLVSFNKNDIEKKLINGFKDRNTKFIIYIIAIVGFISIIFNKNKFIPVALAISAVCFHIYFIIINRAIFRVIYPQYFLVAMLLIYMIDIEEIRKIFGFRPDIKKIDKFKCIVSIVLLAIMLSSLFAKREIADSKTQLIGFHNKMDSSYGIKAYSIINFDKYIAEHPKNVYIMAPNSIAQRNLSYSIFYAPKKDSLENFFDFGWGVRSKYYTDFKERNGISNIFEDLLSKDNFYLVPLLNKDLIIKYIEENYRCKVICKEIDDIDGIKIYKISKISYE